MNATMELLKPSEAAVVSCVRLRDVNRAIDEHILPNGLVSLGSGRHVSSEACTFIAFYFGSATRLTSEERVLTIRTLWERHTDLKPSNVSLDRDWTIHHDFLSIDLRPFAERSIERLERLEAARGCVLVSDEVLGGVPVIRGTRIPVHDIAALVAAGVPDADILEDYPSLKPEMVELAVLYAEANPPRGRPRPVLANLPKGSKLKSERRASRKTLG